MARKRLSDLLREEAKKPVEGESSEATPAPTPAKGQSANRARTASSAKSTPKNQTTTKATTPARAQAQATPPKTTESAPPAEPATTAADVTALTDKIADLEKAIEAAHRREDLLKRQILDLETTLDAEKARSQQLQQDLEQSTAAKQENRPLVSLPSHPGSTAAPQASLAKRAPQPVSVMEAELEKILQHRVLPGAPYTNLTGEDIGWMD